MRDIDIITKAMEDAQKVMHHYMEPGPRSPEWTLHRIIDILERDDVVAARERLSKGYGHLRLVKQKAGHSRVWRNLGTMIVCYDCQRRPEGLPPKFS